MRRNQTDRVAGRIRHSAWRLGYVPAALLFLGLCSCSSSRNQVAGDPFAGEGTQVAVNALDESPDGAAVPIESAVHVETSNDRSVKSRAKSAGGEIIQLSGHGHGIEGDYCPPGAYGNGFGPGVGDGNALFAPVDPTLVAVEEEASQAKYPHEYIYDGGDRATSVHYTGLTPRMPAPSIVMMLGCGTSRNPTGWLSIPHALPQ